LAVRMAALWLVSGAKDKLRCGAGGVSVGQA
jgi:hypothetical protein